MEIKIISKENIKPTSPTPNHLQIYKISILDQMVPSVYIPTLLYFNPDSSSIPISEKIQLLKNSLASTLSLFYPFAGIIKDPFSVHCNDAGIPFSIAKVEGITLSRFFENPDVKLMNKFLPVADEFTWNENACPGSNVVKIQLNYFDCSGFVISVMYTHQISDAITICQFLKSWSENTRGSSSSSSWPCSSITGPDFIAQSIFPQKVNLQEDSYLFYHLTKLLKPGKFITRRYVFNANSISILKTLSTFNPDDKQYPTRVEVISAFIWKRFIAAVTKSSDDQKPYMLTHAVNLRRRAEPSFSDNSFGNFLWLAAALWTRPIQTTYVNLLSEVKRSLRGISKEIMTRMKKGDEGYYENFEELRKEIPEEANWITFSSWLSVGFYEIDFGWGRPVWLSGCVSGDSDTMLPNCATLMETRSGDGVEAWVILEDKYVAAFEDNEELRAFTCINPSII